MKKYYFACFCDYTGMKELFRNDSVEERNKPRYAASVWSFCETANIKDALNMIGGLKAANIMPSQKKAKETVDAWNAQFKANGTYAF